MIYQNFTQKGGPKLAVLVDPDRFTEENLLQLIARAEACRVDLFFVGGSLLMEDNFEQVIATIKKHTDIPVLIFPGNNYQVSAKADALLLLSLISGRNPEYLIGQHVIAAPFIR